MALVRSGGSSLRGSLSRGSGTRWILVDFLRCQSDEQISALSWSPCGRYPKNVFSYICFALVRFGFIGEVHALSRSFQLP